MLQNNDYCPYRELAFAIVSKMCEDYIKSCTLIYKYEQLDDMSKGQFQRYCTAKRHMNEDITFFMSERPFKLCNLEGTFILNKLNEQLKEAGIKCA